MKNKSIVILIPLNIASYEEVEYEEKNDIRGYFDTVDKEREDEIWIKNRINIFMNYTYKSLINQTNQDFTACVLYSKESEELVFSEISKYGPMPENIVFISKNMADVFIKEKIIGSEYVYFVRIDSDDMYHKSYVQKLYDYIPKPETTALLNQWGYLYDSFNGKLFICSAKVTSCYTLIHKTEDYINGTVPSVITDKLDIQMGTAWSMPNKEYLDGLNYAWHVHSKNTLTSSEEWFTNEWTYYLSDPINKDIINPIISEFMG
ncbi:glycosyltransferase [Clostridium beijerinckii]|uniref:Uncharacterized protein n=1 Tax=Clostridium beijerinckii TaxID=1520 RepID=A0A1S8SEN3_CLOBE|nr:glycosyltransferase [Clostridium beijerinckii]NRY63587.1 hypothetical protein [Clostridium beijerinckii]OOM63702.1 hypothetical protein CLBCK_08370 [Clostridium beijerinckii]